MSQPEPDVIFRPNKGAQTRFLASTASEVLYGGAAGGGKSKALIAMPLRWAHDRRFNGLILRRDTTQLADLWAKSHEMYPRAFEGAKADNSKLIWRFPSGAKLWFTHCQHETDIARFDGHEFQLIAFDELTHFSRDMFVRICGRLRGPADLPKLARATTNPGGDGHAWVFDRWAPWLDPKHSHRAKPGERRWYLPTDSGERWCERGETTSRVVGGRTVVLDARSRTFIPASVTDNPHIGPEYVSQLMELDAVRRAQLLDGDWLIQPGRGLYFKRSWFKFAEAVPAGARGVRYWDRAATEATKGSDPDYTVGLRMWEHEGVYYIDHIVRMRGTPAEVEATIRSTTIADGPRVPCCLEQDPGQAGKFEGAYYVRALVGHTVKLFPVMRDKITRSGPVSSQVEHGNVRIVAPPGQPVPWLDAFLQEVEAFPDGGHDDQVDTLSGAFVALRKPQPPRGVVRNMAGV